MTLRQPLDWKFNILLACCFLFVFTETMLSPYYPQFFRSAFGNENIAVTGEYITICRFVVMICAPLWGWLSRYIPSLKILIITQLSTALFTALCALTTNTNEFFIYSILLLVGKSSYVLFYAQLINLRPHNKAVAVAWNQVCLHLAIIFSTLISAWVIQWSQPLLVFYFLAVLDIVQVILCVFLLTKTTTPQSNIIMDDKTPSFNLWDTRYINFMLIIFLLYFSINVIRPYFTLFMSTQLNTEVSYLDLSFTYLLPSLIALISIPIVKYYRNEKIFSIIFSVSLLMLAVSFILQVNSYHYWTLFLARCLFGAFSILCLASVDFFIFKHSDHRGASSNYTAAIAIQNAALLSAPFMASLFVSQGSLAWPFYIAAALTFLVFILAQFIIQNKYYFSTPLSATGALS